MILSKIINGIFDNLEDVIFEIVGNIDEILNRFGIHPIVYKDL